MRLLLKFKFFFLDIVSDMVVKFLGDFMGNDVSYSLGVWPPPKSLGSFCGMEEVRCSVVVDLFSFVFQHQVSHQMVDSRVEPWGGATLTIKNLVKNLGLGTCQAHYDI